MNFNNYQCRGFVKAYLALLCTGTFVSSIYAQTLLYDEDFSEGNVSRGVWTEFPLGGTFDASSGDYVLTNDDAIVSVLTGVPEVAELTDTSIRTQVALDGNSIGVALLARASAAPFSAYQGGYDPDSQTLYLGWNNPLYNDFTGQDFAFDFQGGEELVMQLDVVGDTLKLWAWRPNDGMPEGPQLTFTDENMRRTSGSPGVLFDASSAAAGEMSTATYRYIQVANSPIPEPSTAVLSGLAVVYLLASGRMRLSRS